MTENKRPTIPGVTESSAPPLAASLLALWRQLGFRVLPPSGKGYIMPTDRRSPSPEPPAEGEPL